MVAIEDIDVYTSGMQKSMEDKLWFADILKGKITSVYDYGCADGTLLNLMRSLNPAIQLYGYDNLPEMVARAKMSGLANVSGVPMAKAKEKQLTVCSSVFHEIFSYGTYTSVKQDWMNIFGIGSDYIAIRDMFYSEFMPEFADEKVVAAVREKADPAQLFGFEHQYGSISKNVNLTHWFLKYRYKENWRRELVEDYLPYSMEDFIRMLPDTYDVAGVAAYTLPFLRDRIKEDFCVDWNYVTHGKILLKRKDLTDEDFLPLRP